ncbi:signal peptidase II [Advenella mimigardefordensis]|uniref:Lipoprotein signal peptidase n=1 Tax=Advenella mimigardefordensis (strain DSM 17166 / LMG 22922 / DPN7) TaxID=1247726 RepID=W0PE17_ADVMD|nr:signal peptidase II [Advenella mimigardefordensis]AHG63682.1 lipoprotein signal peptidase [Advenella mimigardefordensis DPN7]
MHKAEQPAVRVVPYMMWIALALVLIGVDQISKQYFEQHFEYLQRVNVLPVFDFILIYNQGAAFSMLAEGTGWQRWFFLLLGLAASAFILFLLRKHREQRLFCLALALILAGALGNVIDRTVYGHVIDFLLFYWNDAYFPAFNLADTFITIGAVLLVLDELLRYLRNKREQQT